MQPLYAHMLDVVRVATFQPRPECLRREPWEEERAARMAEAAAEQSASAEQADSRRQGGGLRWFCLSLLTR